MFMYICIYLYTHVYLYIHVHVYMYIYICIYVCTYRIHNTFHSGLVFLPNSQLVHPNVKQFGHIVANPKDILLVDLVVSEFAPASQV